MSAPISIESTIKGLHEVIARLEKIKTAGGCGHGQELCDLADLLDTYKQRLLVFAVIDARETQKREHH